MARLFWIATGSAVTIVVAVKVRAAVHRYAPAALVDRATTTAHATGEALQGVAGTFLSDFRAARDERATQLAEALLAPTQGSVDDLRARRDQAPDRATARSWSADLDDTDPEDDELGYSF